MNAPDLHRTILRHHVAAIEARHPLRVLGVLPRGSAAHVFGDDALDLLAEGMPQLSYYGISQAEIDLADLIGRPVGIVLVSELTGSDAREVPARAQPL